MDTPQSTRGFGISSLVPHDIVRELAPAAASSGYSMFWVNDLPQSSGLTSLGVVAKAAADIDLGVGVLAVDRWDTRRVAEALVAADIDPARLTIGIGAGQLTVGSQAAVKKTAVGLRELGARRVVVGSLGPKLTRLGGSDADGILLNWVTPAAAESLAGVAITGSAAVGRLPWTAAYTRVASDAGAEDRLRAECKAYESYPAYARHFARFGVSGLDTSILGDREEIGRWLAGYNGILDHVVVRAISAAETVDGYLAVLRASAPAVDATRGR